MPGLADALRSRPLRAVGVIFATICLCFLSAAALGGPGNTSVRNFFSFKASSTNWRPSWDTTRGAKIHDAPRVVHTHDDDVTSGLESPFFTLDPDTGLEYPPDLQPANLNRYLRANATFVSLVRNEELEGIKLSMREVETAFNRKAGYPWVFLNDVPFTDDFKRGVRSRTRSEIFFGVIPKEHWSYPSFVDQEKAKTERQRMEADRVIYGGSESYRHMCRYNSGFFYRHPLMLQFDWYWRIEPGVEYYCDLDYDPFLFMERNNKTYSFTVAIFEYQRTIESLWPTVRSFVKEHPDYVAEDNSLHFMVDDIKQGIDGPYNLCHFWSNFEIADMRFWRSKVYEDFFNYLDKTGNFFYERWGDAPVHSIAAALFLPRSRLHQFDDIGYRHNPYIHCPQNRRKYISNGKCSCDPKSSFDYDGYSCMKHWFRIGPEPSSD